MAALTSEHLKYEKAIKYLNVAHTKFLHVWNPSILVEPVGTPIDAETKETLLKLYLQTFDELSEDVRKILMYSEKFASESRLLESGPPKQWYKRWLENINNHNRIVLCGKCQNKGCLAHFIFVDDTYNYIRKTSLSDKIYSEVVVPYASLVKADFVLVAWYAALPAAFMRRPELYKVLAMLSTCGCSCISENADINDCIWDCIVLIVFSRESILSSFCFCSSSASL